MLGFGLVFEMKNNFSAEASRVEASLSSLGSSTRYLEKQFDTAFSNISAGFAMLKAGTTLLAGAGSTINAAAELEQQQMAFTTMLGSAAKAKEMIAEIQRFAAATPYETPEITKASKQLLAYGFAQEQIIPTMQTLGNVASGLNIPLGQLAYLYGTIKTSGQAGLIDIRQFANRGIPIWEELAKVTGKTVKELTSTRGLKVPFSVVEQAFRNMTGAGGKFYNMMDAQSGTFNGLVSTFQDNLTFVKQEFGAILLPYLKKAVSFFINFAKAAAAFAQTPLGKAIFIGATALGVLLSTLGGLTIVMSVSKFMSLSLANSFLAMGRTAIATAFAQQGLIGGLRAMAVAAYQALLPLLPYIAVGVAIAGVFLLIKKSIAAFDDFLNGTAQKASGFGLILQRIGGIVRSVFQIFSSFDGKTFNLGGMEKQLAELGILDFVLSLGTWIVRIKTYFMGFVEGLRTAFGMVKNIVSGVINFIRNNFTTFFNKIAAFVPFLTATTSKLSTWASVGKYVGYIFGGLMLVSLVALTVAMWSFAVGVIAATWPLLLIGGLIFGLIYLFNHWGEVVDWFAGLWNSFTNYLAVVWTSVVSYLGGLWNDFTNYLYGLWTGLVAWIFSIPERFVSFGTQLVENIKQGILGAWESFKTWLMAKLMEIPGMSLAMEYLGGEAGATQVNTNAMAGAMIGSSENKVADISNLMAMQKAQMMTSSVTNNETIKEKTSEPFSVILNIDGEQITKVVNLKNENNKARR